MTILTLNHVRLMGPMPSGSDFMTKGPRWGVLIDDEHLGLLSPHVGGSVPLPRRKHLGKYWIALRGEPTIHDDVPNPWDRKYGALVDGDVVLKIVPPDEENPRYRMYAMAVHVRSRPTWEEYAQHLHRQEG